MIKVLTIEREYGSGANDIAQKISERLGWKLWDQLLTTEIARRLECDKLHVEQHEERRDPLHYRLFKAFLRGSFEGSLNAPPFEAGGCGRHSRRHRTDGHGEWRRKGTASSSAAAPLIILQDLPDVFHVFVYAPFEEKVQPPADRRERASRKRSNWPRPSTWTARPSSNSISAWSGRRVQYFHLMINSSHGRRSGGADDSGRDEYFGAGAVRFDADRVRVIAQKNSILICQGACVRRRY